MAKRSLTIIRDSGTIRVLSDLVRREILRLLAVEPQTESQLADRLSLSKTSASYHLKRLLGAGLVTVSFTRVGPHGILEKYYEPTSTLFLEDFDETPPEQRRYFVHGHIERLRGMLAAFGIMGGDDEIGEIDPEELKELAQEIARRMTSIGERYENLETNIKRESLLIEIYSETLRSVMADGRWRKFFPLPTTENSKTRA